MSICSVDIYELINVFYILNKVIICKAKEPNRKKFSKKIFLLQE